MNRFPGYLIKRTHAMPHPFLTGSNRGVISSPSLAWRFSPSRISNGGKSSSFSLMFAAPFSTKTKKHKEGGAKKKERNEFDEEGAEGDMGLPDMNIPGLDFKDLSKTPMFKNLMKSLEKQMDNSVMKQFRDDITKPKPGSAPTSSKTREQVINELKTQLISELDQLPSIHSSMKDGWKGEEKIENDEPIYVMTHKDQHRIVEISFPLREEEETEEILDNENFEEALSQNKPFSLEKNEVKDTEKYSNELADTPKRAPCNVQISFLDALGNPKGGIFLKGIIEEDNNYYAQTISIRSEDKVGQPMKFLKLSAELQTSIYALLEKHSVDRQMGVNVKEVIMFNRTKQYSRFLNDVLTFLG